jgi:DNA-binding CsgD family transcriptional regulator
MPSQIAERRPIQSTHAQAQETGGAGGSDAPFRSLLLDRSAEVGTLDGMLAALRRGHGGAALIEGPPGIGKTRLVREAVARARAQSLRVVEARGTELEREFAFGVVRQLFEPVVARMTPARRDELLAGAASVATPLLTGGAVEEPPAGGQEATYAMLHGLYWVVANYAGGEPGVIVVDDAHWADAPSLRFLAYLVNRVGDLPVLVVIVRRSFEPGADAALLDEIAAAPRTRPVRPVPLGAAAVASLVGAFFATEPDESFVDACLRVTHGNPLLLRELLFALRVEGATPTAACVREVFDAGPDAVATSVLRRLRRLGPAASTLARSVAVLGERADLTAAAELADMDPRAAAEAVDALTRAGIFATEPFGFAHQIVRRAIYGELGTLDRAHAHAAAARYLADRGADDDEVAGHLLATDPQAATWPVEVLTRAADRALSCGAPEVAATYLHRALREPPAPSARTAVVFGLGLAKTAASDASGFADLHAALGETGDAVEHAQMALDVAQAHFAWGNFSAAANVAREALGRLPAADGALARRLEAQMLGCAFLDKAQLPQVEERLETLTREAPTITDPVLLATTAVFATARFGEHRGAELADRALKTERRRVVDDILTYGYAANAMMTAGRLREAQRVWDRLLDEARRAGSQSALRMVSSLRAYLLLRLGDVTGAEADARFALERCQGRVGAQLPFVLAPLVDVLVERGELAAAAKTVEHDPSVHATSMFQTNYLLDSLGRLRLAEGRAREAVEHLRACARSVEAWGIRNPGVLPWRTSLALALVAEGERDEALALATAEVALAREFAVTRELGMALRAAALATADDDASLRLLGESVATLEGSQAALELARSLVELGAALHGRGDDAAAREPLRRGLDLATRCGATALARRAHQVLIAAGARPRRLALRGAGALTASERRIAAMAADGLANREIAQALFLSEKTVEGHLGHAYRKLEITARSQLRDALGLA